MDEEDQPNSFDKLKPVSIDENGEPIYLLGDYIQQQIDEDDAEIDAFCAVFGECNDVECSYNKGYLKRQALYACHTCIPDSKLDVSKAAGVCLACSLHCHNGHDLVELYTKRNFRCDCGNSKFKTSCTLISDKVPVNAANSYNQNFTGLYCTCARPYPDPDDDVEDDMISCSMCEDWFHTRHLGIACPPSSSYEEMICEACVKKHDFLLHYDGLTITKVDNTESAGGSDVNIVDINEDASSTHIASENITDRKMLEKTTDEAVVPDNAVDNPETTEDSEQILDDVDDITNKNEEMDVLDPVSISQQERNDICENLDDISRQCEEIDKAVDDSTKQEALAAATQELDVVMDNADNVKSADNDNSKNEQKSIENVATPVNMAHVLENKEELTGEGSSTFVAKKHITIKLEVKEYENIIHDGESKRNCKKPKTKLTQMSTKFYESSRWRENLCTCTECTQIYTEHNVAYLLDPQDTLQFYKEFGREAYVEGAYGAIKRKIDSLPHREKIMIVEEMTEFKDKFASFLKQFADDKRVVTAEDVRFFIGNLDKSRKRRKVQMESNYYCR